MSPLVLLAIGFLSSLGVCVALVLTQKWHGHLTSDPTQGVQKFHQTPVPRIGGAPIVLGLVVLTWLAPASLRGILKPLLLAGLLAFAFGIAEDLTQRVGVALRLLATMAAGVLAWWMTGHVLTRVDVWGLDAMLQWLPFALLFTAFAIGGIANAINIIDGLNGLSAMTAMLACAGLAGLSFAVGDRSLAWSCLSLLAVVLGFFVVNWPLGKIFLGDGGAYFVGFALAWLSVLLVQRHQEVTAFAPLLVCAHPVAEVLLSIYRRKVCRQRSTQADRLHFHSLFKRRYVSRWFSATPKLWRNSIAGIGVGSLTLSTALLAQWVYHSVALSCLAFVLWCLAYVALYARMVRHRWCSPISFLFAQPAALAVVANVNSHDR